MPPAHYNCILPAESYDGDVGTIRVRWSNSAMQRLHEVAGESGVPVTTMKAVCEHLAYMCAERLENGQALIRYENPTLRDEFMFIYMCLYCVFVYTALLSLYNIC